MTDFIPYLQIIYCKSVTYISSTDIHRELCWKRSLAVTTGNMAAILLVSSHSTIVLLGADRQF